MRGKEKKSGTEKKGTEIKELVEGRGGGGEEKKNRKKREKKKRKL
jgi:hypothetical protein